MHTTEQLQRAEILMSQGNAEEAEKLYGALCRMEHLTVTERGIALFGLGACFFVHENYTAALSRLQESWELLISGMGMKDPLTTRTMVLLSRTHIALGKLEIGMEIGHGALENLVELYGPEDEQTATAAFFLSAGAYQFGRLAEAEKLTLQALRAWEKLHGRNSLQVASCLDALGKLRNVCGEKQEGAEFQRQALDIKLNILGEHEITAASLGHLGMALADMGDRKGAEALLARSLDIFKKLGADNSAEGTENFRKTLAQCRNHQGKESNNGQDLAH